MPTLRKMLEIDVAAIAAIESQVSLDPWPEKLFSDCIKVGYSCWVLEHDKEVIGYGLFSCAASEAHILNLVIEGKWRRQGLGTKMMQHLLSIARELGADIAYLEVRESNLIARELYHKLSFTEIGIRKSYYPDREGREDAVTLALGLS